jgi:hypothetical protein
MCEDLHVERIELDYLNELWGLVLGLLFGPAESPVTPAEPCQSGLPPPPRVPLPFAPHPVTNIPAVSAPAP